MRLAPERSRHRDRPELPGSRSPRATPSPNMRCLTKGQRLAIARVTVLKSPLVLPRIPATANRGSSSATRKRAFVAARTARRRLSGCLAPLTRWAAPVRSARPQLDPPCYPAISDRRADCRAQTQGRASRAACPSETSDRRCCDSRGTRLSGATGHAKQQFFLHRARDFSRGSPVHGRGVNCFCDKTDPVKVLDGDLCTNRR
jgi:hypothetical protein